MAEFDLIATTTFGLESVVKEELKDLGYEITNVENGRVEFSGTEAAICRSNLWLRCAERVLLKVGEFEVVDFDELYEKTKELSWPELLPVDANFPVNGKSVKSQLSHVPSCQSIVKKAVVDSLKEKYNCKWFPENGPHYTIQVALLKDRVTLTLDSSGSGLHKRGYRELSTEAPLQETIAAGMIYLSKWNPDRILIDPFCGSGTIPIEAALMGINRAPGLNREFAAEDWHFISDKVWNSEKQRARDLIKKQPNFRLLMGFDKSEDVIGIARFHARRAEVLDFIHFQQKDFADFTTNRKYGYVIANPPYGQRLNDQQQVRKLYKQMGEKLNPLETWSYYILSADSKFEQYFGQKASKRRKLYNGGLECQYFQYYGPWPPSV